MSRLMAGGMACFTRSLIEGEGFSAMATIYHRRVDREDGLGTGSVAEGDEAGNGGFLNEPQLVDTPTTRAAAIDGAHADPPCRLLDQRDRVGQRPHSSGGEGARARPGRAVLSADPMSAGLCVFMLVQ